MMNFFFWLYFSKHIHTEIDAPLTKTLLFFCALQGAHADLPPLHVFISAGLLGLGPVTSISSFHVVHNTMISSTDADRLSNFYHLELHSVVRNKKWSAVFSSSTVCPKGYLELKKQRNKNKN